MTTWSAGYMADIGYIYGYYPELNTLRSRLALLHNRFACPQFETACELGFGQGLSPNFHAAATTVKWYGNDFNPAQAGFARELAAASEAGAELSDEAFAEFVTRTDLPDFDFIGLHGIWSWISDSNRHLIVDFIRRKLRVGGVLYISYNTLPGWAAFAPMRHLLTEHVATMSAAGQGVVPGITAALTFAEQLLATNPLYLKQNPAVAERLGKIKEQNSHYLAHEYFNRDWHPMHFATMQQWLEPAKVQYACSAHYADFMDVLHLSSEQQQFLAALPDPMFRESVRDFMVNQQFRREYWIKGARKLSALERHEALLACRVVLVTHRPDAQLVIKGALQEGTMDAAVYNPILDFLADHQPRSIAEIGAMAKGRGIAIAAAMEAVVILVAANHLAPAQDEATVAAVRPRTEKLNRHIQQKARGMNDIAHLASPLIGGGFPCNRFQQLFLLAYREGKKDPEQWAQYTWGVLDSLGEKLLHEGKPLATPEENLAELTRQAREFAEKSLPVAQALQIV
jgi:SAM-dependent methyltransferase